MFERGNTKSSIGFLAVLACCGVANAAEPGALNYPPGSSGVLQNALPPIPGLFAVSQTGYSYANGLYDGNGNKISALDYRLNAKVETLRLIASYPFQLFGAHLYQQVVIPLGGVNQTITPLVGPFAGTHFDSSSTGLGNVAIDPFILLWDLPNHQKATLGLEIGTPLATYDKAKALAGKVNFGNGYTSFMPVAGYRYDVPNGPVASVMGRAYFNTTNSTTNYRTGTILEADFNLGWNFDRWQVGIVGSFTKQVSDDVQRGVAIGNRLTALAAGPSIAYNFGAGVVNLNYQPAIHTSNGANTSSVWLNVAFPLYVPTPPKDVASR